MLTELAEATGSDPTAWVQAIGSVAGLGTIGGLAVWLVRTIVGRHKVQDQDLVAARKRIAEQDTTIDTWRQRAYKAEEEVSRLRRLIGDDDDKD